MTRKTFRLGLLALDGCMLSSLAAPADALRVAQVLADIRDPVDAPRFESIVFSARNAKHVLTESGIQISGIKPLGKNPQFDLVLVPGIDHRSRHDIMDRREGLAPELSLLRALHLRGT